MTEPDDESKGFKVTDRRKFTPEGEPRDASEGAPEPPPAPPAPPDVDKTARRVERAAGGAASASNPTLSDVAFLDLVGMLATNAMLQLGDLPDPASGENVENLPVVQQMITFLEILRDKTRGNLTGEEGEVLDQVLYDLRMRYMAKAKILNL
jgi:Domain of unknown function (DUF1844)